MAPTPNNARWIKHLKKTRREHPNMEYQKVQKLASKTYKPAADKKKKAAPKKPKTYANGTPYNYGRSWAADRRLYNKSEEYEVPPSKRKLAMW